MKVKPIQFVLAALALAVVTFICGCSEDQTADPNESNLTGNTNYVPTSLGGKSYTFTVTSVHNFQEPFNADYTIDFNSDTGYTLHPTPQKNQSVTDHQGNYTYEPRSGVIHFVETSPTSGRTIDAVFTYTSATTGTAHLSGRNGEIEDAVFVQTSP